jgi:acetolactate synthase I/II/III large subunit
MKLSDYVFQRIAEWGVKHVFMLPGGGAMHLNNSLGHCPGLTAVSNLHEQAAAIAAEAYARVTNHLGVALVTTGPGGTNAVTGVAAAWLDSTPCLFISGQVKRADRKAGTDLRQLGVQELDIVTIVQPITKYAVTILDPSTIRFHLEKAYHLARAGRPGPVWLDIPLDVQAAEIDPEALAGFHSEPPTEDSGLAVLASKTLELLAASERPILLAGNGIRLAGAIDDFHALVDRLRVPVQTTWLGMDLMAEDHPLFAGRPGAIAPRGANFALQNSDLLLTLGARLDMAMVGYAYERLARAATKVMVDIDPAEIAKLKGGVHLPVCADVGEFIRELLRQSESRKLNRPLPWLKRCQAWKAAYPVVLPEHRTLKKHVSTYLFSETLSKLLPEGALVASMSAGACVEILLLAFQVKAGQRIFHNRGTGSMGLAIPASLAACLASGGKETICIEADGGFQMNNQELQTIRRLDLPIKIFVLNNRGYASIRASQSHHFGRLTGADTTSGLTFPDTLRLAQAYELPARRITSSENLAEEIQTVLTAKGPFLCEVMMPPDEVRAPCISSRQQPDGSMVSAPLEDLWPFLDREEFRANMLIPPLDAD